MTTSRIGRYGQEMEWLDPGYKQLVGHQPGCGHMEAAALYCLMDRARRFSSTSELVNTAVRNLLEDEHAAAEGPGRPDLKSLELARDAPANPEWLHLNRAAYTGEWVALHKGRLIAHGHNGMDVFHAAQSQGINPPLMHRVACGRAGFLGRLAGWRRNSAFKSSINTKTNAEFSSRWL